MKSFKQILETTNAFFFDMPRDNKDNIHEFNKEKTFFGTPRETQIDNSDVLLDNPKIIQFP